jgi:transcriptional regulator with XRE-family HTH domain
MPHTKPKYKSVEDAHPIDRQVGANVRAEMARVGKSQEQIAAALRIGQASMSDRLRGVVPFRIPELVEIAHELGVPLNRFFVDID